VTDLLDRAPAHAVMEKVVSLRGTPDLQELPFGLVRISKDGLNWMRGVRGELEMAKRLGELDDDWTVLHSIPVGFRESDIDHLVIGPAGVFPINSKRLVHRTVWVAGGRLLVDGSRRDYLRNSAHEAARVEGVLRAAAIVAPIVPVIAISGAKKVTVRATPIWNERKIGVAQVRDVVGRIRRRPTQLSGEQVERIVALLRDSQSWTARDFEREDAREVRAAYDRIDRGTDRWRFLGFVTAFAAAGAFVATIVWLWAFLT
jgi:hypothetical protein